MTVQTTTASQAFQGNSITTSFPCNFKVSSPTDIVANYVDATTGAKTPLALNTDFTLSGVGSASGFTVLSTLAVPTGQNLLVQRVLSYTQPADFTNQGAFFPSMHEEAFDRLEMQIQQLSDAQALSVAMPAGLVPNPSMVMPWPQLNGMIGWNQNGNGQWYLANVGGSGVGSGSIVDGNIAPTAAIQAFKLAFDDTTAGLDATTVQAAIEALAAQVKPNNAVDQVFRDAHDGNAVTVVCLGDSITWGYHPDGTQASQPYPVRLQNLLQQYYGNSNILTVNSGVPGDTVAQMIARWDTDVAAHNPDVIVFNGGTNDAREANAVSLTTYLANLLQVLKLAGSTPVVIMGLTPRFKEQESGDGEGVIDFYRRTLKMVADYFRLPYIDTFTRLHNLYKGGGYRAGTISTDGSHYTDDGYVLLGEIVFLEAFANDNLTIKPGQFKDLRGQWLITAAADSTWGASDTVDSDVVVVAANATLHLYLYLEDWQNASLVLHTTIDNSNAIGQSVAVQNQSITSGGIPIGPSRTFTLSQKANAGVTTCFLNDYPINTVKLRPGLNNVTLTAGSTGARISGVSVLPAPDYNYMAPYFNDSHGGSAESLWSTSFNQSPQAFETLRPGQPLVIGNAASYVQPYFRAIPDYDGVTARWRFRGSVSPSSAFFFGQQQNTSSGVAYAYKLSFDGTNAKLEIRDHAGTLRTCATVALAITSTGQDITVDFASGLSSWSLWVNATLIYTDTIPLSIGQVYASTTNATYRTYLNPPIKKGPNVSDTGTLIGEQYISFVDGKLHYVSTAGTDKSVAFV